MSAVRDEILKRAAEISVERPRLRFSECVAAAGLEVAREVGVEKSAASVTLQDWCDIRIAELMGAEVAKSDVSYSDATRHVAEQHPGLLALRHCGVANLPKDEAVVELTKALAAERNEAERTEILKWLAELR